MDDNKLLSVKIRKADDWERFGQEDIGKLAIGGMFVYIIVLAVLGVIGFVFDILIIKLILFVLLGLAIIPIAYVLISSLEFLVERARLKAKIKKLPLNHVEVMINFGNIDRKELETAEAFKLYVEYLKAITRHEAFGTLGDKYEQIVLTEISKYDGEIV